MRRNLTVLLAALLSAAAALAQPAAAWEDPCINAAGRLAPRATSYRRRMRSRATARGRASARSTGSGASASRRMPRPRRTISCGRTATCPTGIRSTYPRAGRCADTAIRSIPTSIIPFPIRPPQSGATILRVATCGGSRCPVRGRASASCSTSAASTRRAPSF